MNSLEAESGFSDSRFFVHIKMILSVTSLHFLRSLLIILHCLALGATGPGGELEAASAVSQIVASRF